MTLNMSLTDPSLHIRARCCALRPRPSTVTKSKMPYRTAPLRSHRTSQLSPRCRLRSRCTRFRRRIHRGPTTRRLALATRYLRSHHPNTSTCGAIANQITSTLREPAGHVHPSAIILLPLRRSSSPSSLRGSCGTWTGHPRRLHLSQIFSSSPRRHNIPCSSILLDRLLPELPRRRHLHRSLEVPPATIPYARCSRLPSEPTLGPAITRTTRHITRLHTLIPTTLKIPAQQIRSPPSTARPSAKRATTR